MRKIIAALLLLIAIPNSSFAQVTLNSFKPAGSYANLSVSTSSSNVAVPAGNNVVIYNTGSNAAYVTLGSTSTVTATTSAGDIITPGGWIEYSIGISGYVAAITAAGTTTLTLSGGTGILTGAIGATGATTGGNYSATPLGYAQLTPVSSTALTTFAGYTYCIVQAEGQTIRFRDDGVAPTTTVGMQIFPGGSVTFSGTAEVSAVRVIQTATGGLVDESCYK